MKNIELEKIYVDKKIRIKDMNSKKGKIFNTVLQLKKEGYAESTLKCFLRSLLYLDRHIDLDNPESVKLFIANRSWSDGYKANVCDYYNWYCKINGIEWVKPKYSKVHKIPKVPTEERINLIIAHASPKYALILSMIRDSGTRPIEMSRLTLKDIDLEKGTISIRSTKGGNPRILKLKNNTSAMLKKYVKERKFSLNDRLFPSSERMSNTFERLRTRVANILQDHTIKQIRLYDLRHFYATMLYHRTRDILLVKEKLGHKKIENTLIYTHLVDLDSKDEFTCKTAKTVKECSDLIECGFEYVTELDSVKLFRKRK